MTGLAQPVGERLDELAPDGVNGFFDNVGGPVLDAVLDRLALRAKVTICGAVSQYNHMDAVVGPSSYLKLAERQSSMEGFAYFHFPDQIPVAELVEITGEQMAAVRGAVKHRSTSQLEREYTGHRARENPFDGNVRPQSLEPLHQLLATRSVRCRLSCSRRLSRSRLLPRSPRGNPEGEDGA